MVYPLIPGRVSMARTALVCHYPEVHTEVAAAEGQMVFAGTMLRAGRNFHSRSARVAQHTSPEPGLPIVWPNLSHACVVAVKAWFHHGQTCLLNKHQESLGTVSTHQNDLSPFTLVSCADNIRNVDCDNGICQPLDMDCHRQSSHVGCQSFSLDANELA